ncbi:MAG: nucleoside:proton symporter [Magnetococcales bacterium]|nr:nucleoside:proton symporter [Magnetococcales bacterium]
MVQGLFGISVLTLLAFAMSENKKLVNWRSISIAIVLQFVLAYLLLKFSLFKELFLLLNSMVLSLQEASKAGTSMVFGYLGGGTLPFVETFPGASFLFAFQALPLILLMSALSALLYYWKILPVVVRWFSVLLQKSIGIGGALGFGVAMNIFVGMIEAPVTIRPYLNNMTRSEMFAVMTCGMATIAGTVMVLYAAILGPVFPDALGHLLTASIISAPAALALSLLMIPEDKGGQTAGESLPPSSATGTMDAIHKGTSDGVQLLIQVMAMMVVLIALVELVNQILSLLPTFNGSAFTLQRVLGWIMAPIVWLIGVPWSEAHIAGSLMGTKTILNEFIAYLDLVKIPGSELSDKSRLIMIYAMCGFANLGSLGIMIGGIGGIVPERRREIMELGPRSIVAGTLATCMTGAVVGIVSG